MNEMVSGTVAAGFELVGDAFRASFIDDSMGASLCVYLHGSPVVDLYGGVADARHNTPRIGRVLMARGRDAVDVALTTAFGLAKLVKFQVWTDEVQGY